MFARQGSAPHRPMFPLILGILVFLSISAGAELADGLDELKVDETSGEVKLRQQDRWQSPQAGMAVDLPTVVSTGADGSIRLSQGKTTVSVAANTAVELLQGQAAGQLLQRAVQEKGSAFYDVETQESSRFRVETPYLVAVVKGTQFNVTVTAESSTVALYEGRLRIDTPDGSDTVELREGQIAKRHRDDPRITVLSMDDGEPVARIAAPVSLERSSGEAASLDIRGGASVGGSDAGISLDSDVSLVDETGVTDFEATAELGGTVDISGAEVDLELDGGVSLGDASVDAGLDAGVDLGEGEADLGVDGAIDLGDASVDAELDAAADLGDGEVDLGVDGDVDLGDASVDAGLDAGADLGDGDLDASLDSGLDLGDTTVDAGLDAGADLTDGDVDLGLDTSADLGDTGVDAGLEVDASLDGLDADLDADLDLGLLDGSEEDAQTEEESEEDLLEDLGNLLGL